MANNDEFLIEIIENPTQGENGESYISLPSTFAEWQELPLEEVDTAISNLLEDIKTADDQATHTQELLYEKAIEFILTRGIHPDSIISTSLSAAVSKILRHIESIDELHTPDISDSDSVHPFIKRLNPPQIKMTLEEDGGHIGRKTMGKIEAKLRLFMLQTLSILPVRGATNENLLLQEQENQLERIGVITSRLAAQIFSTSSPASA